MDPLPPYSGRQPALRSARARRPPSPRSSSTRAAFDSRVTPAMCGVRTGSGSRRAASRPRAARARTRRAPRRPGVPTRSAAATAASSTTPPRAVLIRIASGFIVASRAASIRLRVAAVERHVQRDHVGLGEQRVELAGLAPLRSLQTRTTRRDLRIETDDAHAERAAEPAGQAADAAEADEAERLAGESRGRWTAPARGHPPARDRGRRRVRAAQQQHRGADHVLGDGERVGAGRRNHLDPPRARRRRRRCCRDRRPAARRPAASAPPRAARRSTCVRLRTISASASASRGRELVGAVDEVLVVERVVRRGEAARPRRRP